MEGIRSIVKQSRKLGFAHGKQGNNSKCVSKQGKDFGITHFASNPFQLEFYVDDQSDKGLTPETSALSLSLSTPHRRSTTVSFLVAQAVLETEFL